MKTTSRRAKSSSFEDLNSYFMGIKQHQLLSYEEEQALSKRIQKGDAVAREQLIVSNLRLVVKIAQQYANSEMSLLDLIQEGNLGLIHAVEKFDFRKEVRFSTYASWWIKQSIGRSIANKRRAIKLPHRKEEALRRIQHAFNVISQRKYRAPTVQEICDELGLERELVVELLSHATGLMSLDAECGDDQGTMYDLFEDSTYDPLNELLHSQTMFELKNMIDELPENEALVIRSRFGLGSCEKCTLKELSQLLSVSPETVRQIEMRGLRKLRAMASRERIPMAV